MTQLRLPYFTVAPEAYQALRKLTTTLERGELGERLLNLVYQRISQINGCAYCLDLHGGTLRKGGESAQRMDGLAAWREGDLFGEAERAALQWAESLTHIGTTHAPDADFAELGKHFSERQIAELTFAAAAMNAWNRVAISMRQPVARKDQ